VSPGAQTPTLLLQGERDNQEEIALLSSWLRRAGGVVEVVVYPGEGHWITAPAHRSDFWRRTLAWFDRYV